MIKVTEHTRNVLLEVAKQKKVYLAERRQALKDNDMQKYEQIVQEMVQKEEQLVQSKLSAIQDKLGIRDEDFHRSTEFHARDQRKGMMIMQMQQKTQAPIADGEEHKLSRAKTLTAFKKQQTIQMEQMDEMIKDQQNMGDPYNPEN